MKITLAQLNYIIGDFDGNTAKIITAIKEAKSRGVDLVVFSELCVCGYPPLDLLEHKYFVNKSLEKVDEIASVCTGISAIVGAPELNRKSNGKNLYNSAFFLNDGKTEQVVKKTLLPTYDVFDEYRYFESNTGSGGSSLDRDTVMVFADSVVKSSNHIIPSGRPPHLCIPK